MAFPLRNAGGDTVERQTSPTSSPSKSKPRPEPSNRPPSSSRLAPPALFQGPPSRNSSNVSLQLTGAKAASTGLPAAALASTSFLPSSTQQLDPLKRVSSRRTPGPISTSTNPKPTDPSPSTLRPQPAPTDPSSSTRKPPSRTQTHADKETERDRSDALWAEMQSTLAEVELSAAAVGVDGANSSHVFGAGHAQALEELRKAQLALALAWGRSEREEKDEVVDHDHEEGVGEMKAEQQQQKMKPGSVGNESSGGDGKGQGQGQGGAGRRKTLEEETENDILLARTRREANDRYFEQVNNAVVDVVRRLDDVAGAMRRVEKESRDIWSDEDGGEEDGDGSVTGGSTTGG